MPIQRIFHMQLGTDGGTERFFLRLTKAFHARGIEQQFAVRPGTSWRGALDGMGRVHEGHYLRRWPNWWLRTQLLRREMRRWPADVVMGWRAPTARLMPSSGPAVRIVRLGDYPHHLGHFGHVDCIVGNAPNVLSHCENLGWTGRREIISNFATESGSEAVPRSALDTPEDATLVFAPGRFVSTKGFDTLVRAVARTPDLWLWLAGDGPDRADLEALVDGLGLRARTRFIGWVSDPSAYAKAADIYCVPSRKEPLGNVLLEGWMAGVPVISTRTEGPSWAATDRENALMVDIDDVAGFAGALGELAASPALRAALVEGGHRRLSERFSEARVVDQYLDLFERLRSGRG
ncbi:Glycosyltransferase involved in cell wall bisynthesis [Rhizobium sp. RU20A]|nr:Glycosyltransferase involved in cell wall bisynthesis [Rhizobium sp. RU20A]